MTEEVRVDVVIQAALDGSRGDGGQGIRGCSRRAGRERRIARRSVNLVASANGCRRTTSEAISSSNNIEDGVNGCPLCKVTRSADTPTLKSLASPDPVLGNRKIVDVADRQAMTTIQIAEGTVACDIALVVVNACPAASGCADVEQFVEGDGAADIVYVLAERVTQPGRTARLANGATA